MDRLSCLLFVLFCTVAVTVSGEVQEKDPWFPWWSDSPPPPAVGSPPPLYPTPDTPSPYYDAPPYMDAPPSYPPPDIYPPSYPPMDGPEPSPWFSSGLWAVKTDAWPAPYQPDTPIEDALGPDAMKVYGQMSMLDGISSKGDDGFSVLLKQGVTSLLNAVDAHFKYTEDEIKKCFSLKTALSSEAAATVQAKKFEAANTAYSSP